ncbi:dihydrolipoamide dehydrogenase [Lentibacillus persicus]|uniref:Dihydrolipoyl dehydrogenase n=1 Tax=Lentibacillus persicus TaxID=640948 RepID=A0A1I1S895_9BACI|nr:dihydrolipoyl dehydrogenase [Lentibacillus persicus]SFD42719.1 dihydrolipoamide dehydrogenase [Lentibacillus persicus]
MKQFDILIIGSGPGGYVAAEEATRLGHTVGVIERDQIGGCCLNVGCIPSKTYLQYSHWLNSLETANRHGLKVTINEIDFPSIVKRKNDVVSTLQNGISSTFKQKGIQFIEGEATFIKDHTFEVEGEYYSGRQVLLATGGHPFVPDIPGLQDAEYVTTDTFFNVDEIPGQFVTIGGGVIAVELAFAMQKLGSEVTVVEVASDILLTVDKDARAAVKQKMKEIGIEIITNADIKEVTADRVALSSGKDTSYDQLLVATGRRSNLDIPNAMNLSLDSNNHFVKVDEYYETSKKGVYAIGDIIGDYTLAHAASAEGIKAIRAMSGHKEKPIQPNRVPRPVFTSPEVSEFGMSEEAAQKAGYDTIVEQMPFSFNGRAIVSGETEGFIKLVTEKRFKEILGAVVVGENATDLLHEIMTAYEAEGTIDELANTIYAHPTVSELIKDTSNKF